VNVIKEREDTGN